MRVRYWLAFQGYAPSAKYQGQSLVAEGVTDLEVLRR